MIKFQACARTPRCQECEHRLEARDNLAVLPCTSYERECKQQRDSPQSHQLGMFQTSGVAG
jgi:hypothetical protein